MDFAFSTCMDAGISRFELQDLQSEVPDALQRGSGWEVPEGSTNRTCKKATMAYRRFASFIRNTKSLGHGFMCHRTLRIRCQKKVKIAGLLNFVPCNSDLRSFRTLPGSPRRGREDHARLVPARARRRHARERRQRGARDALGRGALRARQGEQRPRELARCGGNGGGKDLGSG